MIAAQLKEQPLKLQRLFIPLFVAGLLFSVACDDEGGDDDDSSSSSSSGSNCSSTRECLNGVCECTTSGKEGTACCDVDDCGGDDPNNCPDKCQVCS